MTEEKEKLRRTLKNVREALDRIEKDIEKSDAEEIKKKLENQLNNVLNPRGVVVEYEIENGYEDMNMIFVGDTEDVGYTMKTRKTVKNISLRI